MEESCFRGDYDDVIFIIRIELASLAQKKLKKEQQKGKGIIILWNTNNDYYIIL